MQPDYGFDLETFAEFEPGTGLGGSSALAVAVIGALNYFRNENQLDLYHIADLAYQAERIDMGIKGGWQDQYATAFGGFNWIEFRENEVIVNPLRIQRDIILELEYNLMLFRIGAKHNSGDIQSGYIQSLKVNEQEKNKHCDQMAQIAVEMKEAILRGKVKQFGDLLHASWEVKKTMGAGITNPQIDDFYAIARKLGALGGKLLGAGGSGYLLVYASPLYQRLIQKALEDKGARFEPLKFTNKGLEVWTTPR
jgi:D-glycero-alpha-D-manno-heptose-7-phosphate kinase